MINAQQLADIMKPAIANGLQMAILNVCESITLGWALSAAHLPRTVVMREAISDRIAHLFVTSLTTALAERQSLSSSICAAQRDMRTHADGYAGWLPTVIEGAA